MLRLIAYLAVRRRLYVYHPIRRQITKARRILRKRLPRLANEELVLNEHSLSFLPGVAANWAKLLLFLLQMKKVFSLLLVFLVSGTW